MGPGRAPPVTGHATDQRNAPLTCRPCHLTRFDPELKAALGHRRVVRRARRDPARPAGGRPRCGAPLLPHPGRDGRARRHRGGHSGTPGTPRGPSSRSTPRGSTALVLHDNVIDLAEGLLGTTDLALYMGIVTAKYADQASGYNQLLHADYPNHMLVVPRHEVGYQQVEFFIYLTDVTTEDGATRFVSWQKTKDIPVERHTLNYVDYAALYDDPSDAAAPAGSVVAYRPDVYHRSVDHTDPTALPGDAPRLVPPPRCRLGRVPGMAVPGLLARAHQVRAAGHPAPAGAPGGAAARATPTGTRRPSTGVQASLPRARHVALARRTAAESAVGSRSAWGEPGATSGQGIVALGHEREVEQELLAVVAGQHLQPDRQARRPGRPGCSPPGCR